MQADAVVFDAYGTLFDVHSVATRCDDLFPGKGASLSRAWRSKQLEYTWLRTLMGRYEDFETITRAALHHACRTMQLECGELQTDALLMAYRRLTPYADVGDALERLRGTPLAILSNGTPPMLEDVVGNAQLRVHFQTIVSVDALKLYKPHPRVYQLAVDRLGVAATRIAFVSSNYWDVAGASAFGFRTFWINRAAAVADELGITPAMQLKSLSELPGALG